MTLAHACCSSLDALSLKKEVTTNLIQASSSMFTSEIRYAKKNENSFRLVASSMAFHLHDGVS